ncbi:MAG: hypothetical protein HYS04_11130, partial [Acidobacteria bacterium]|nr:hypothetical protein [Acidobacteriota bacterium]
MSLLAAITVLPVPAFAAITCNMTVEPSRILRPTGLAELLGDILLTCSGGTSGTQITTDITVSLNTYLNIELNSKVEGGWSEVLLLVDDPAPAAQVPGSNVFQAVPVTANEVRFNGVSFAAPGAGTRRLRIVNIRANATQLGLTVTGVPFPLSVFVRAPPPLTITNSPQTVTWEPDLTTTVRDATDSTSLSLSFPQCAGQNAALVTNPAAPGGTVNFNVKFTEGFSAAFKRRSQGAPDAPSAQNLPGQVYDTETGFYNPAFPATNGLNTAGLASQGTRLMINFRNVPPGLRLYVTTTPSPFGTSAGIGVTGARLVQTDSAGAGPYTPVTATTTVLLNATPVGIAPVTLVDGAGSAVWEILSANPLVVEQVSFGVVVAYESNAIVQGGFFVARALAPLTNASATLPRFVEPSDSAAGGKASITSCDGTLPDLVITSFTAPASAAAGDSIPFSLTVKNQGTAASGRLRVRVSLYSDPALASPLGVPVSWCSTPPVLNPFETHFCSGNLPIPASFAAAPYYIGAVADDQLVVTEANEANNSVTSALSLSGCSISLGTTSATVPPAGGSGYILLNGPPECTAPLASSAPWITLPSYTATIAQIGSSRAWYTVAPNTDATPRIGTLMVAGQVFTVTQWGSTLSSVGMKIGIYRSGSWQLDLNGNGAFDSGSDRSFFLGWPGATIVTGDWNGDGKTKAGVYSNGYWFLDYDGNGLWDNGAIDKVIAWG